MKFRYLEIIVLFSLFLECDIFSVILRAIKVVLSVKDTYKKESSGVKSSFSLFECPLTPHFYLEIAINVYSGIFIFLNFMIPFSNREIFMSAMNIFLNEI